MDMETTTNKGANMNKISRKEVKPYVVNATTRLDLDVLQEIDALATELNLSRSKVISELIADGMLNMNTIRNRMNDSQ